MHSYHSGCDLQIILERNGLLSSQPLQQSVASSDNQPQHTGNLLRQYLRGSGHHLGAHIAAKPAERHAREPGELLDAQSEEMEDQLSKKEAASDEAAVQQPAAEQAAGSEAARTAGLSARQQGSRVSRRRQKTNRRAVQWSQDSQPQLPEVTLGKQEGGS